MRMHTIPQNVTAYEDRIVGMLIGRQFIYLAIGGIAVFILLASNVGPLLIRVFLSFCIGGFSAAMALLRIDDRGFDSLVGSYARAMFGPTEWVWRKDSLSIEKLATLTAQISQSATSTSTSSQNNSSAQADNLRRVSRFQSFISARESGMDNEDYEFVERLDFSAAIPQKLFVSGQSAQAAPPMLTRNNFAQVKQEKTAAPPKLALKSPPPVAALAGNSSVQGQTINFDLGRQSVHLRHNQQTNRSLSKQLLSSGVLPLPIRGEQSLTISPDLKVELKELVAATPLQAKPKPSPTITLTGAPIVKNSATPQKTASAPVAATTPLPSPATPVVKPEIAKTVKPDIGVSDEPIQTTLGQLNKLSQYTPKSGITKTVTMNDASRPSDSNQPANNQADQLGDDPVIINKPAATQTSQQSPEIDEELQRAANEAEHAIMELNKQAAPDIAPAPAPSLSIPTEPKESEIHEHHHTEYSPVPVPPVIAEQQAEPSPPPTPSPAPQPISVDTKVSQSSTDLQSRMAAAGIGTHEPITASNAPTPTGQTTKSVVLTTEANIINGNVLDSQGAFVPGVIVVVKNSQGESKRALKTNKLGQFVVTTPLNNGTYTVEVDKKGLSFDIMKVELTGSVLPPLEIKSKSS